MLSDEPAHMADGFNSASAVNKLTQGSVFLQERFLQRALNQIDESVPKGMDRNQAQKVYPRLLISALQFIHVFLEKSPDTGGNRILRESIRKKVRKVESITGPIAMDAGAKREIRELAGKILVALDLTGSAQTSMRTDAMKLMRPDTEKKAPNKRKRPRLKR